MADIDRYAVTGYPVAHSKSPFIHAQFAEQTGEQLSYDRLELTPENFVAGVHKFFAEGGKGLNVTVPHKETAWRLVDWLAPNAELAGAVNTLYQLADGRLTGDNTDGTGMVRDIEKNHGGKLAGANIMIIGAGGAVRGVLPTLIAARPASITIVNRTLARAASMAEDFRSQYPLRVLSLEQLQAQTSPDQTPAPDWLINGSSAGLQGEMPALPGWLVSATTGCYDMVYAPGGTVFQQWARERGALLALDGSGMLVEQAAESFRIWRGVQPETQPVIAALHALLAK